MSGDVAEIARVMRLARRFKTGDRVIHTKRGWIGTVTGERSDSGIVWCRFDAVGQVGADPRKLTFAFSGLKRLVLSLSPRNSKMSDLTPPTIDQSVVERALRPEVLAFAMLMERQLQANDHKPGWKGDNPNALVDRCQQEWRELAEAVAAHGLSRAYEWNFAGTATERDYRERMISATTALGRESADVANFAMMIADVCGALPSLSPSPIAGKEGEVGKLCERLRFAMMASPIESDETMILVEPDLLEEAAALLTQMEAREQALRELLADTLPYLDYHGVSMELKPEGKLGVLVADIRALLTGAGS